MDQINKLTSNAVVTRSASASYVPDQELYQKLLNEAPLLMGEDKELYREVFNGVLLELQPQSLLQWLLVRDVVDKRFEERRYQRLKVEFLENARKLVGIPTKYDGGRELQSVGRCLAQLETLSRMETNCANFRRTAMKDFAFVPREGGNSPSVVPD